MGETPTHGKIKVNISKSSPKTPPSASTAGSSSSYSAADAVQAACKAAGGSSSAGLGLDFVAGDGPLDASGRPGWPAGDSGKGGVNAGVGNSGKDDGSADADTAGGAVFKTVEWYGTIRLLVFTREGEVLYHIISCHITSYNIVLRSIISELLRLVCTCIVKERLLVACDAFAAVASRCSSAESRCTSLYLHESVVLRSKRFLYVQNILST